MLLHFSITMLLYHHHHAALPSSPCSSTSSSPCSSTIIITMLPYCIGCTKRANMREKYSHLKPSYKQRRDEAEQKQVRMYPSMDR